MLVGQSPFADLEKGQAAVTRRILRGEVRWREDEGSHGERIMRTDPLARDLVEKLVKQRAEERLALQDAMVHPFLTQYGLRFAPHPRPPAEKDAVRPSTSAAHQGRRHTVDAGPRCSSRRRSGKDPCTHFCASSTTPREADAQVGYGEALQRMRAAEFEVGVLARARHDLEYRLHLASQEILRLQELLAKERAAQEAAEAAQRSSTAARSGGDALVGARRGVPLTPGEDVTPVKRCIRWRTRGR
eukprot:g8886.t1